ncbi:hypothetical protein CV102_17825 [Natronococcus pandeyae]|uniref:Peptidase C-terminal archaeal/bacterial domain-containing protein n=1 Tax=Natronococcus pandeyae TaxID=2055836 RepID=A0A8J8Q3T3_9EURY|nr:hypothetical protein CV102_17825 [Natronococcus pandeyae]
MPLVGGGIALSTAASADQGSGTNEIDDESTESRPLECGELVSAQFTEDDPRTPTGEDAMNGARGGYRYHEYHFDGYANERVYFSAYTDSVPNPNYEPGYGDDPVYYKGDPALFLFDGDELIGYDPEAGYWGGAHVAARLPSDGTYRLVATAAFKADPTFEYVLEAYCSDRTPVTDRSPELVPIECGETIVGEFTDDDVRYRDNSSQLYDVYTFEGKCGDSVTITTRSAEEPARPRPRLFDPDGRYDGSRFEPDGTYVPGAETTFTGEEFVLSEYRLPKTGTYTIWVSSYGSARYEYELSLECWNNR